MWYLHTPIYGAIPDVIHGQMPFKYYQKRYGPFSSRQELDIMEYDELFYMQHYHLAENQIEILRGDYMVIMIEYYLNIYWDTIEATYNGM